MCEHITAKPPKAICSPGFFESDGLCIQRRETPCEEQRDGVPFPWDEAEFNTETPPYTTSSEVFVHEKHDKVPTLHKKMPIASEAMHEIEKKPSRWETLRRDFNTDFMASETVELHSHPGGIPKGSQDMLFDGELGGEFDYGLNEPDLLVSYGDTEGHTFGHQWPYTTEGTEIALNEDSLEVFPRFVSRRRLKVTASRPDQNASGARDNATEGMRVPQPSWNSSADHPVAETSSRRHQPHSGEAPTRFHPGLPLVNTLGRPYASHASIIKPMNPSLLHPHNILANPVSPVRPSGRPAMWHDHRFDSPVGSERGPFARQQRSYTHSDGATSGVPGISPQHMLTLQRLSAPLSRQSANGVGADDAAAQRTNVASSQAQATTVMGGYSLPGHATSTTTKTLTANGEGWQERWLQDGRHFFTHGPTRDLVTGLNSLTEEIQAPIDWACDPTFSLDLEQFVCIRVELRRPDIICDGKPEGDFCINVVEKPPQWYCPLDPPPSSSKKDDKNAKYQAKKKEKAKEGSQSGPAEKPKDSAKKEEERQQESGASQGKKKKKSAEDSEEKERQSSDNNERRRGGRAQDVQASEGRESRKKANDSHSVNNDAEESNTESNQRSDRSQSRSRRNSNGSPQTQRSANSQEEGSEQGGQRTGDSTSQEAQSTDQSNRTPSRRQRKPAPPQETTAAEENADSRSTRNTAGRRPTDGQQRRSRPAQTNASRERQGSDEEEERSRGGDEGSRQRQPQEGRRPRPGAAEGGADDEGRKEDLTGQSEKPEASSTQSRSRRPQPQGQRTGESQRAAEDGEEEEEKEGSGSAGSTAGRRGRRPRPGAAEGGADDEEGNGILTRQSEKPEASSTQSRSRRPQAQGQRTGESQRAAEDGEEEEEKEGSGSAGSTAGRRPTEGQQRRNRPAQTNASGEGQGSDEEEERDVGRVQVLRKAVQMTKKETGS
ncbi:hypothetical protein, conserved [Eimeria praecox]|uniref:Uncharacterized protein n=1 Tax=Eimeria praecox TaxID=51316 RepID=U6H4K0_9EIME|nr:hypothetical protein, conserved [Eimeria praecox]